MSYYYLILLHHVTVTLIVILISNSQQLSTYKTAYILSQKRTFIFLLCTWVHIHKTSWAESF